MWSIGVILYEMITGTDPFAGETFDDIKFNVRTMNFDITLLDNFGYSPALVNLVKGLLEYSEEDRLSAY